MSLCLVLFLVSLATVYAFSDYHTFVERSQLSDMANRLVAALRYARSQAMYGGRSIILCPVLKGRGRCASQWAQHDLVAMDRRHHVLRRFAPVVKPYIIHWKSRLGFNQKIQWQSDGWTNGQQGSFWICQANNQNDPAVQIILLGSGRTRIQPHVACTS